MNRCVQWCGRCLAFTAHTGGQAFWWRCVECVLRSHLPCRESVTYAIKEEKGRGA